MKLTSILGTPRRARLFLSGLVLFAELAARGFHHVPVQAGQGLMYSWECEQQPESLDNPEVSHALKLYRPDRGGEWRIQSTGGLPLGIHYFEWDRIEAAPTMVIDGHPPELCNGKRGFRLLRRLTPRQWQSPGGEVLEFDTTQFEGPAGRLVYLFKNVWLGNTGNLDIRGKPWLLRLQYAFVRHSDAARVLQASVSDARSEEEAWNAFSSEVLAKLAWSGK